MRVKNVLTSVALLFVGSIYGQNVIHLQTETKAKLGLNITPTLNYITSPETNAHDFKRGALTWGLNLGPRLEVGNYKYRVALSGYGAYQSNETIFSLFKRGDYKARRSLGYGGLLMFKATPWFGSGTVTTQIGNRTEVTRAIYGISFGVGYENLKTFYKIPRTSDLTNGRFNVFYGQVAYSVYAPSADMDFFVRYGMGENKSSFIGIGGIIGLRF